MRATPNGQRLEGPDKTVGERFTAVRGGSSIFHTQKKKNPKCGSRVREYNSKIIINGVDEFGED